MLSVTLEIVKYELFARQGDEAMKVTLLGTAAAEGWPGLFCRCEACMRAIELGGRNIRTRSSAIIDDVLKIDFPPDILHQVICNNLDLRRIRALLFTHGHDDHFSPYELQYRGKYFVPTPLTNPLPIYAPEDIIDCLALSLDSSLVAFTLHLIEPGEPFTIDNYQITPLLAQHDPSRICFNYVIEDSHGINLLYASDTGWYEEPTWSELEKFKLDGVLIECTKGMDEGGYQGHLSIPELIRLRARLIKSGTLQNDTQLVATHFSHLCGLTHDQLTAKLAPHNIQPAYDGMTFTI